MNTPRNEDTLMRDTDMTILARLKVDPEFVIALYHEQRKRIAELEARVDGYERILDEAYDEYERILDEAYDEYERILDEAYDEYLSGCTADELHDILKEVLEYAPRRNWEEK